MADIDVVQKQRSGLSWVWMVLLAAVVVLLAWWLMVDRGATTERSGSAAPVAPPFASADQQKIAA